MVERTLAWLARYRKRWVRYERRAGTHESFPHPGGYPTRINYLS